MTQKLRISPGTRVIAAVFLSAVCLVACGNGPGFDGMVSTQQAPIKVVIRFTAPVAYKSEDVLRRLGEQSKSTITYLSSISEVSHVYSLQPALGQDYDITFRLLEKISDVERVTPVNKVSTF